MTTRAPDGAAAELRRRAVLAGAASAWLAGTPAPVQARTPSDAAGGAADAPTLIVAGPPDSAAADWARRLAPDLEAVVALPRRRSGHAGSQLDLRFWGGMDGVTGVNQFAARILPGAEDALVFPGAALMAALVGDPRVSFDVGRLLPLLARVGSGILMLRGSLRARRAPVRVAVAPWSEQSMAGFLGLDLLRVAAEPVPAPGMTAALERAVDALFVHGPDAAAEYRTLLGAGLSPVFAIGARNAQGTLSRDPDFASVPTLPELLGPAGPQVADIWSAVSAASVLETSLAVPALSSGAMVARWRTACHAAATEEKGRDAAHGLRVLTDAAACAAVGGMSIDAASQIELRRWVASRLPSRT